MESKIIPNKLIKEISPYLLKHAYNPIDWHPWGDEAFKKAREEDKPIFLSIGYSTCHWCHVMEEESYNDPIVAELMNEVFVPIKVDREERPDIDNIYMSAAILLTGSGGWPLNIIATSEGKPFFAATYISKESAFGRIGLLDLMEDIKVMWRTQRDDVVSSAENIVYAIKRINKTSPGGTPRPLLLDNAYKELSRNFDDAYGGFGVLPKFPTPHNIGFLLRYFKRTGIEHGLNMACKTLDKIRLGGIYDHIGGGIHRYSVDEKWILPHFEKMLYDQALIAIAYIEAYEITHNEDYKETAKEIFSYVMRDMTDGHGGFYSAEDADSEGMEGKFYLWKEDDIKNALGRDAGLIIKAFSMEKDGNFVGENAVRSGENILYMENSIGELSKELGKPLAELKLIIEGAKKKLFDIRNARIRPYRDDKILTDWNGLMIAALAKGGVVFEEPSFIAAAEKAAHFILENMTEGERLFHMWRRGKKAGTDTLSDYAFFVWGLIELYEATFDAYYLKEAIRFNQVQIKEFMDREHGGFYFTPESGEKFIVRAKEGFDGAIPSGNSVAMLNMLRLFNITGIPQLREAANLTSRANLENVIEAPSACTQFLNALSFAIGPSYHVTIVGDSAKEDARGLLMAVRREFHPNLTLVFKQTDKDISLLETLSPSVKSLDPVGGKAAAYVCKDFICMPPVTTVEELLTLIRGNVSL